MLKFNQLKTVSLLLFLLAPISTWGMEGEPTEVEPILMEAQPAEESITLVASDSKSKFDLPPKIVKLSGAIQGYLEELKETGIETKEMLVEAKPATLALFTNLANDIQQAINKEKDSDKSLDQKIQASSGHIFAKNLQPIVNAALQNQDLSTLEELLNLAHFLEVPQFENAIASAYIAKDLNETKQKDPNFSLKAALQQELSKIESLKTFTLPTKELLAKHLYLQNAGITDEWSINDLMQIENIGINLNNFDEFELSLRGNKLTSLDGLNNFPRIEGIRSLNLDKNKLTMLPENTFKNLTALKRLYLGNNQLTMLPENTFKNLTALKYLYLGDNKLTTLPENIFNSLSALKFLKLDENPLSPQEKEKIKITVKKVVPQAEIRF